MTPNPHHYRSITAYRLAQAQHAEAQAFARKFRRMILGAACTVLAVLALFRWPGITLAVLAVGAPLAIAVKAWIDVRYEAREFNEEHDLP